VRNTKNLLFFIKERFPLHILTFTTLSSVLASAVVSGESYSVWQVIIAFAIVTFFLFHIRAIDERRDFVNDSRLHPQRPVQQGLVSVKTLLIISVSGILISLGLAFFSSIPALLIALLFVGYTTLAAFDFFVPSLFENKPVMYHIINSPQMILVQWLIFAIFSKNFTLNSSMVLFMLLIYNNIFILEVVRKVKDPSNDTADSYTSHLGLKKSVSLLIILVLTGCIIYCFVLRSIGGLQTINYIMGASISALVVGLIVTFYLKPEKRYQKIMELSSVLFYVALNFLIYFAG